MYKLARNRSNLKSIQKHDNLNVDEKFNQMKYKIHKEKICQRNRSAIIWLPGEREDSREDDGGRGDGDDDDEYADELLLW